MAPEIRRSNKIFIFKEEIKMKRRILSGILVAAMATAMLGTTVFAETGTATTDVSYNNTNQITDPDNPEDPQWAVEVPSSIVFTDDVKEVDATVKLVATDGGSIEGVSNVSVTVASDNEYELELAGGADPVDYTLTYSGQDANSGTVGTLSTETNTISGKAVMTGTATQSGNHTDTLTYTVDTGL